MALPIDPAAALVVALAATQQPWRTDQCGSCDDVSIADVGGIEVCARQAPIWADAGFDEIHERDAAADARHIVVHDPPTMVAAWRRMLALERAVDEHADLVSYLIEVIAAELDPVILARVIADAPESGRPSLRMLLQLQLIDSN